VPTRIDGAMTYYPFGFCVTKKRNDILAASKNDLNSGYRKKEMIKKQTDTEIASVIEEMEAGINNKKNVYGEIMFNNIEATDVSQIYISDHITISDDGDVFKGGTINLHNKIISAIVAQEMFQKYGGKKLPIVFIDVKYNKVEGHKYKKDIKENDLIEYIIKFYQQDNMPNGGYSFFYFDKKNAIYKDNLFISKDDVEKYVKKIKNIKDNISVNESIAILEEAIEKNKNSNIFNIDENCFNLIKSIYNDINILPPINKKQSLDNDIILAHSDYLVTKIREIYDYNKQNNIAQPPLIENAIEVSKIEDIDIEFPKNEAINTYHQQLEHAKKRGLIGITTD
jgi:hypothetical protein